MGGEASWREWRQVMFVPGRRIARRDILESGVIKKNCGLDDIYKMSSRIMVFLCNGRLK